MREQCTGMAADQRTTYCMGSSLGTWPRFFFFVPFFTQNEKYSWSFRRYPFISYLVTFNCSTLQLIILQDLVLKWIEALLPGWRTLDKNELIWPVWWCRAVFDIIYGGSPIIFPTCPAPLPPISIIL